MMNQGRVGHFRSRSFAFDAFVIDVSADVVLVDAVVDDRLILRLAPVRTPSGADANTLVELLIGVRRRRRWKTREIASVLLLLLLLLLLLFSGLLLFVPPSPKNENEDQNEEEDDRGRDAHADHGRLRHAFFGPAADVHVDRVGKSERAVINDGFPIAVVVLTFHVSHPNRANAVRDVAGPGYRIIAEIKTHSKVKS